MSRIKIEEPGWEKFTGHLGPIEFVDAVSVEPVSTRDAMRIGGSMRVSYIDGPNEGKQASVSAREVELRDVGIEPEAPVEQTAQEPAPAPAVKYTREQLEELADKKGIKGLREIAEPLGVRNTSIAGLIDELMALQPKE